MVCIAIYGQRKQFRNGLGVQLSGFAKKSGLVKEKQRGVRREAEETGMINSIPVYWRENRLYYKRTSGQANTLPTAHSKGNRIPEDRSLISALNKARYSILSY